MRPQSVMISLLVCLAVGASAEGIGENWNGKVRISKRNLNLSFSIIPFNPDCSFTLRDGASITTGPCKVQTEDLKQFHVVANELAWEGIVRGKEMKGKMVWSRTGINETGTFIVKQSIVSVREQRPAGDGPSAIRLLADALNEVTQLNAQNAGAPDHWAQGSSGKLMLFGGEGHRTYLGCLNCSSYAPD